MPAKDIIHDKVKYALINDGWTITHEPYPIRYKTVSASADLGAERTLAAEKGQEKIVVEVKSFIKLSPLHDFEIALGQYNLYLGILEIIAPERKLYLAVNDVVYRDLFKQEAIELILNRYQVSVIVVNLTQEVIVQWIKR
jgi:hypothetical protein